MSIEAPRTAHTPSTGFTLSTLGPEPVALEYLADTVRRFAAERGEAPALTVLGDRRGRGGARRADTVVTLTYRELDERARAVAAEVQAACPPRARVAVLCPHDEHYVVAFLACLYAGVIAVPLYAPELFRSQTRLRSVLRDSTPGCVLTTSRVRPAVRNALSSTGWQQGPVLHVDEVPPHRAAKWRRPPAEPDDVAYLQYTSGSTGAPAGVRVTHANLSAAAYQMRSRFMPARTAVSWVPLFHDMGLVCAIASPLSAGMHMVHLSPMGFLHRPYRWLRALSDYRADWTVTPNFGLTHCVRRVTAEEVATLDLSGLRALAIGGEPVHARSVAAFVAAFADAGLDPRAPVPCYGLAEATLSVTMTPNGTGATGGHFDRAALSAGEVRPVPDGPGAVRLVSNGTPVPGVRVRIADPETGEETAGRVGEIWVSGPNRTDGYWRAPERTARVYADGWLRTGDWGFRHEGGLYVVGRMDDVIIVRGRNHYPEDIEATVESVAPVAATAIGVEGDPTERLIVLMEADAAMTALPAPDRDALTERIRQTVSRQHGLAVHATVVVRKGTLPRTTSGKIQRGLCRQRYAAGAYPTRTDPA
ncbi:fatty acyl-AMP ligase [Streptomyces flavofungini]|uniref:fatty acyl-AMP ligase n=1 Tax=Streptomyces flavofungini TaxID=68200 RepID=UPI0025AFFEA9|nr:fatty acyl-AMP ligase [Streptomyces flavofungini]WJV44448.1 fatty acyl-AMP ligase [Streptomyces flavofungini]